jgi:hypothetical protein
MPLEDLEETAVSGFLPLGSWRLNVYASRPDYLDTLGALFRQDVRSRPLRRSSEIDAELYLLACAADSPAFADASSPADGSVARWRVRDDGELSLFTGRFRVLLRRDVSPHRIVMWVREPQYSAVAFRDHLFELISKVLFSFDRFYVHAGAVCLADQVSVFVGQGSFGKSTTCLRLARAGGTILSEDHVLFSRSRDGFLVSGCQETIRVTPKTEAYFFGDDLNAVVREAGGVKKKEFPAHTMFAAMPYVDFPFTRLFFNEIGDQFEILPMPRKDAVLRMVFMTRSFFRHNHDSDLDRYLQLCTELVGGRECYQLRLSRDLGDLDRLVEFLA